MSISLELGLIRDTLKDDSSLQDQVGMRIYPEGDYDVNDVDFPCITFELMDGEYKEQSNGLAFDRIKFFIYSQNSKKECYEIYDNVKRLIKGHMHYDTNYYLIFRRSSRPKVRADSNPKYKSFYFLEVYYEVISDDRNQE